MSFLSLVPPIGFFFCLLASCVVREQKYSNYDKVRYSLVGYPDSPPSVLRPTAKRKQTDLFDLNDKMHPTSSYILVSSNYR
jgi:hypothetical protein